jgi:hypothetical protein
MLREPTEGATQAARAQGLNIEMTFPTELFRHRKVVVC